MDQPTSAESDQDSISPDEDFASDGWSTPPDPDADIANTHASNEELKWRKASESCFETFAKLNSLWDESSRESVGSMPNVWYNQAIPLFEHNGTGYQLHFSYTWMRAIHTYSSADSDEARLDVADCYLHCLARDTGGAGIEVVLPPLFVIPLGKLFINKDGHSAWTGYEIFVSSDLKLWIVYVPDEDNPIMWHTVDSGLFVLSEGESSQNGTPKLAQFWPSLRDLHVATFEQVREMVRSSGRWDPTDCFYLLEIATSQIEVVEKSNNSEGYLTECNIRIGFISERIWLKCWPEQDLAAGQLLLLAKENTKKPFVKLVFGIGSEYDCFFKMGCSTHSLLRQAVRKNNYQIIDRILKSRNILAYANESDFDDTDMFADAVWGQEMRVIKLLLDSGKIDISQPEAETRTPLVMARARLKTLKESKAAEESVINAKNIISMLREYEEKEGPEKKHLD
ncbi:hypothetical protein F5X97DRAFT_287827 [Nemania serpens]|nr:hypothetical protein F5X97DRAFT_287827 [Nemania serpens]